VLDEVESFFPSFVYIHIQAQQQQQHQLYCGVEFLGLLHSQLRKKCERVGIRANRNSLWLHPAHLTAVPDCRRLFQSLFLRSFSFFSLSVWPFSVLSRSYLASIAVVQSRSRRMLLAVTRIGRRFSFPRLFTCVESTRQTTLQLPILMFHATLKILFLFLFLSLFLSILFVYCYSIPCSTSPVMVKWLSYRCVDLLQ
jgi:hypothetical protein